MISRHDISMQLIGNACEHIATSDKELCFFLSLSWGSSSCSLLSAKLTTPSRVLVVCAEDCHAYNLSTCGRPALQRLRANMGDKMTRCRIREVGPNASRRWIHKRWKQRRQLSLKVKPSIARSSQRRINYHCLWAQLSSTCSNALK